MNTLKKFLFFLLIICVLASAIAFFLPDSYKVERSTVIRAPEEKVFQTVNDLRNWDNWSPWKEMDPTIKITLSESTAGIGAQQTWTSETSGTGSLKITHSEPNKLVNYDLNIEEWGSVSKGTFVLENVSEGVKLIWMDEGDLGMNPINRYIGLMMDSWMGKDFEKGLANIKKQCEG